MQGLSGKEAEIVRLVCVTSIMGKLPTACRLSFCAIFQEKKYVAKNSFIFVSLSFHFKTQPKQVEASANNLTWFNNTSEQWTQAPGNQVSKGDSWFHLCRIFKIVKSYPLSAATGAEWHFLCPGGKCPGRSTQEGSLPHRTHVGKRRVILNDSWCPKYNCTFFNDHVKALWGAQNIRG